MFRNIEPTQTERNRPLPGDNLVERPVLILERAMMLSAPPEAVFPWLRQLGKRRGTDYDRSGWYCSRRMERSMPRRNRALRSIDPDVTLPEGQHIEDWVDTGRLLRPVREWAGMPTKPVPMFYVELVRENDVIVLSGERGRGAWSWTLQLYPAGNGETRLHTRLQISFLPWWLPKGFADWSDALLMDSFRIGLQERLTSR